jgi:murein DD-endopeptidase MepM/ murein hydrolase activator NlpD
VLESYYCWDQPILAPAAGTVAGVVTDLPDNPIGSTDPQNPAGNHVVLDFGNGEFGFLGHMRQGSIRLQPGDEVEMGQELGRCGNSGNTSEPHLHFHLQTTTDLSNGDGLPAFFNQYVADDQTVERGEPEAGLYIQPAL